MSFYPDAKITKVYDKTTMLDEEAGITGHGWVQVNLLGYVKESNHPAITSETTDALLLAPYSFQPSTEEHNSSANKLTSPMNQQYGVIVPPRRGDRALVVYAGEYFVIGVFPAPGGNEPPSFSKHDLSFIHRSGASIRINDKHPGVTAPAEDEYDGITGAMSTVANRAIHLIGSKFLPYGLMAEHASQDVNIGINDGSDGYAYADIFDDAEPSSTYYQPWDTSASGKKFVGPPHADLNADADVGSDEFYLLHQGGGLLKMAPINTDYTGTKMSSDGMTIAVGTKYWDAGLQNKDTHDSPALDSTVVTGELNIVHESGAKIRIDTSGNVYIDTNGQTLYLGDSGSSPQDIVKHGDSTTVHSTINFMGAPCYDQTVTPGHSHTVVASQSEVKIP